MPSSAELVVDAGFGPSSVPLSPVGGGQYEAALPPLACGAMLEFFVSARSANGFTWTDPPAGHTRGERHRVTVATSENVLFADDFETDQGWTTSWGTPVTGFWERVDPHGTPYAPEHDHSRPGTKCWVTDDSPTSSNYFEFDVSYGPYWLTSPVLDLSAASAPFVRYARWFANDGNFVRDDLLEVEVTSNGVDWVTVEAVGPTGAETQRDWYVEQFHVRDFVPLSSTVQVRISTSDIGNGSGTEAAVDDFLVFDASCDPPAAYCTAKLNSCGAFPAISSAGSSSASSSSGFTITGTSARPGKPGLLIYSASGALERALPGGDPVRRASGPARRGGLLRRGPAGVRLQLRHGHERLRGGCLGGQPAVLPAPPSARSSTSSGGGGTPSPTAATSRAGWSTSSDGRVLSRMSPEPGRPGEPAALPSRPARPSLLAAIFVAAVWGGDDPSRPTTSSRPTRRCSPSRTTWS